MALKTRIYIVRDENGTDVALIRAATRVQALAHFARRNFRAELPSQDELLDAAGDGIKVEDADDTPELADAA